MTVRLPLTLVTVDGFLVEIGASVFVILLDMIEQCVAYTAELRHNYTNLRGYVALYPSARAVCHAGRAVLRDA